MRADKNVEYDELGALRLFRRRLAGLDETGPGRLKAALWALFADTGWVEETVDRWIDAARRDPFFAPPCRFASGPFHSSAVLIEHRLATVSFNAIDPDALRHRKRMNAGRGSVFFPGRQTYLCFLRCGGLTLSHWKIADADEGLRCRRTGSGPVSPGRPIAFDMARHSYVFEAAGETAIFLHAELRVGGAPLAYEFDVRTGRPIGRSSGSEIWSRIQMMLSVLRTIDYREAAPAFRSVIADAPFFARWQAMREWLALDRRAAWPVLVEMAEHDPHTEIRAAAQMVVDQYEPVRESGEAAACR